MPIDPSQVVWDEAPKPAGIDPAAVTWDDAPASQTPQTPWPTGVMGLFAGPRPLQGNTTEERQADYRRRPAAMRALVGMGQFVDRNVRGLNQLAGTENAAMDERSRATDAVIAGDLPTTAGRYGTELAALYGPSRVLGALPSLGARMAGGATLGAASAGLQAEDAPGERGRNMAFGAAFGAGGEAGAQAIRAAGRALSPEVMALYNSARKFGIELTPAQLTNSEFLKRAQGMMKMMPLSGATRGWERQVEQFNRALSKTFGEDAPRITTEVFSAAKSRIGRQFDELAERSTLQVSDGLMERLGALQQEVRAVGDDGSIRAVESMIDRLMAQAKDGQLPGAAYKSLDSQVGKIMANGGEKSFFLGQFRDAVREAMDESIPAELKRAWQQARGQYRALKTVEPLVAKSADGAIQPAQLMGRVTANRAGKASMAAGGGGDLGELARVGQAMKAPASSGTAENIRAGNLFNPIAWPFLAAGAATGATAGRALNSGLLTRALTSQQARPALANALARMLPGGSIAAAPVAAAAVVPEKRRRLKGG